MKPDYRYLFLETWIICNVTLIASDFLSPRLSDKRHKKPFLFTLHASNGPNRKPLQSDLYFSNFISGLGINKYTRLCIYTKQYTLIMTSRLQVENEDK